MWNLRCLMNLAVTAMFIKYAFGASHIVGAPGGGWDQTTNFDAWTKGETLKVGDTLVFQYAAPHSVFEVPEADYKTCNGNNPISSDTSGNTVITLSSAGKRFFICGITSHCSQGMKLEVEIVGSTPSSPPPKPTTPSPPPPSPATPSPPPPSPATPSRPPPSPATPSPPPIKSPPKATSPPTTPAKSPPKPTTAPSTPATPATPPKSQAGSPSEAPASSPTQTTATGTNSNSGNRGHKEVKFAMVIGFGVTILMSL